MRSLVTCIGSGWAVAMVVAALWMWQNAAQLTLAMDRPDVAIWAARSAAVALAAAAQVILMACVRSSRSSHGIASAAFRWTAAGTFLVSLVCAVALGLAGR